MAKSFMGAPLWRPVLTIPPLLITVTINICHDVQLDQEGLRWIKETG